MDDDERRKTAERVQKELAAINAADNPENEERVRAGLAARGVTLKKAGKGRSRFSVVFSRGDKMQGVTQLDAEKLLTDLASGSVPSKS